MPDDSRVPVGDRYEYAELDTEEMGVVPQLTRDGQDFVRDAEGNWWHLAPRIVRDFGFATAFSASHMQAELEAALRSLSAETEHREGGPENV